MKTRSIVVLFALLASIILGACAPATPAAAPTAQVIIQTVEVPKEVQSTVVVQQTVEVPKSSDVVTIGYSAPELIGGQGTIMASMINGAESKGWKVIPSNANSDAATQANQIDSFISLGVKAIVAVPVDSKAVCASVQKAHDAGIFFFTIDRAPLGCEVDLTIQSDNYLAGKQSGEELVKLLKEKYGEEKGTVLELQGDLGQNVAQLRGGGFDDVLKQYPKIVLIQKPTNWDAAKFASSTQDVASSTDLDAVYMHSDCVGTKPVTAALQQVGKLYKTGEKGHIFLVGVDGCRDALQSIRDGYSNEASSQPITDFGVVMADYMEKIFNGEQIKEETVTKEGALWSPAVLKKTDTGFVANLATTAVTKENVDIKGLWGNQ